MNTQLEYQLNQQYRDNLLREAQNERLAQQSQPAETGTSSVVAAVGRTLVKLGEKLQGEPETFVPARKLQVR